MAPRTVRRLADSLTANCSASSVRQLVGGGELSGNKKIVIMAPRTGLEPVTFALTARCSAIELSGSLTTIFYHGLNEFSASETF